MDDQFCIDAIAANIANVQDIEEPVHSGPDARVLIARTPKKSVVCKFDHPNICRHDVVVSKLLRAKNIPVPNVQIRKYGGTIFTTYDFIPNHTLEDFLVAGAPREFAESVYRGAMDTIYQISQIRVNAADMPPYMFATQSEYTFSRMFGAKVALYHNDLHAGNILVSNSGKFGGLLDVNSITLGGQDVFLARAWTRYPADNFEDLLAYWGEISHQKMNTERIDRIRAMTAQRHAI